MVKIFTEKGAITVSHDVFTNIAGLAATNCFGVRGMAMRSMSDGLVHLLKREVMSKGVLVSFSEEGEMTIALHIIIKNGINIPVLCDSIISEVRYKVESATGVEVKAVDIFIDGMMLD
jgi:uncharacterized alkaline shock family protein YloU